MRRACGVPIRRRRPLGVLLLLLAACGCRGQREVTGKVTVQGKPLTSGNVVFVTDAGEWPFPIEPDGTYKAMGLPLGAARIILRFPQSHEGDPPGTAPPAINPKYTDPSKTPANVVVKDGTLVFNIDVRP
jgi:hypothetical protein